MFTDGGQIELAATAYDEWHEIHGKTEQ